MIDLCEFVKHSIKQKVRRMRLSIITFAIIIVCTLSTQPYIKVIHNVDESARCLDGSPAVVYEHIGEEKDKFLIFFGGGGSCGGETLTQTIENCYQRSKTYLGSSKYMLEQMHPQGMLSTDSTKSKFASWSKFIFAYCDGSFHQGNRISAVSYKDAKLYLRGATITRAHLKYIQQKYNLRAAKQVVVAGVSAGAMAAFMWANHIQTLVDNPNAVSTVVDSGIFINDTTVTTGAHKSALMLDNLFKLANANQDTPFQECNNFTQKGKQWNCFFFSYSYSLVKGRLLNILSLYDSYDLMYQYEISCITSGKQGETFANCTTVEQNAIEQRYQKTLTIMDKFMSLSPNHSTWAISCANHVYVGSWKFYSSQNQAVSSFTAQQAVQKFVLEKQRIIKIDNVKWPNNAKCAY